MTRGPADRSAPFDLSAITRSGELVDALSTRRTASGEHADDPAVRLLTALTADVDAGAPPLPTAVCATRTRKPSRRGGVRAFVALGVASVVLTTAGAAAAGGGGRDVTGERVAKQTVSERSNASGGVVRPARPWAPSSTSAWPVRPSRPSAQFEPQGTPESGSPEHGGEHAQPRPGTPTHPGGHPKGTDQSGTPGAGEPGGHGGQSGVSGQSTESDQTETDSADAGGASPEVTPSSGAKPDRGTRGTRGSGGRGPRTR